MEMEMEVQQSQIELKEEEEEDEAPGSIFAKTRRPVTLQFQDVMYTIKTKGKKGDDGKSGKHGGGGGKKVILKGVSGTVKPGEMLAMLGPSGSGKTTLLTVLGGRTKRTHRLTGSVAYNGRPFSSAMKRTLGFVTQDDVLYPHLTVAETLYYTAMLRLPGTLSRREKAEHAMSVLEQLGLAACRDGVIGGPFLRGISGGERKRVSIGQEMLINPSLLLLDEPTSGLDSTIAGRIVSTLWELTQGGRTVVMTIHQPSSRLFYMFHKVLLLSDGHPVYFGKGSDAMAYFSGIGYAPTVAMNPADFLLDLANGVSSNEEDDDRALTKEVLVSAYRQHLHAQVCEELAAVSKQFKDQPEPEKTKEETSKWCTSWWAQFTVLYQRDMKERKYESFSILRVIQVIAVAFLSGILWFRSGGHVQDQVGLLFFINGFWGFYPSFQAIYTFPLERGMLSKERSSGMYRLSSYFGAKMVGDLRLELILPIVFTCIAYWMGGLKPAAANFFMNLATILLNVLVAQGVGLAVGAIFMNLKNATTFASVLMLAFMLAGGFFVQNIPPFISWIKYISFSFYTFKLQLASQFAPSDTYQCTPTSRCAIADLPAVKTVGLDNRALPVVALFLMLVLYRLAAYVALMRIGVTN